MGIKFQVNLFLIAKYKKKSFLILHFNILPLVQNYNKYFLFKHRLGLHFKTIRNSLIKNCVKVCIYENFRLSVERHVTGTGRLSVDCSCRTDPPYEGESPLKRVNRNTQKGCLRAPLRMSHP